jgi:hypothetical protein
VVKEDMSAEGNERNTIMYDTFNDIKIIENYLDDCFTDKYFSGINKHNIYLKKMNTTLYTLKIISSTNYYFDFFMNTDENLIYYGVLFTTVDKKGMKCEFELNRKENFDELFTSLNKEMKKYLLQSIY